ncbi:MAG: P-loop NTPase [Candidatus Cloacimonetes bacterium]|nr:P-loop NTPase [Candidatus Cloacimonadota bacterium]
MDPRKDVIDERLKGIKRIISITGGKGGIGKTSIATLLALQLAEENYSVGLFDLDFSGPSAHLILNKHNFDFPEEENGIIPPIVNGVKFMTIVDYTKENPSPMRGVDVTNAILEILAITRWDKMDFLVIDMPPGISDSALDIMKLIKRSEFLVAATPSKISIPEVANTIKFLKNTDKAILGTVINMIMDGSELLENKLDELDIDIMAKIGYDKNYENAIGDVKKLLQTDFAEQVKELSKKIAKK